MENNQNFLDKNTIIATLLILAIWFGYGHFFPTPVQTVKQTQTPKSENTGSQDNIAVGTGQAEERSLEAKNIAAKKAITRETSIAIDEENISFTISSIGMSIKDVVLKSYTDRAGDLIKLHNGQSVANYETQINDKTINFDIEKVSANEIVGTFENENMRVKKVYNLDLQNYTIKTNIELQNKNKSAIEVASHLVDFTKDEPETSIFSPNYEKQEIFVSTANDEERGVFYKKQEEGRTVLNIEENFLNGISKVAVAAVSSQYFTRAIIDYSDLIPSLKTFFVKDLQETYVKLYYPKTKKEKININYKSYVGPKKAQLVSKVDTRFADVIDFGFFSSIAKPIFRLLIFFYDLVHNYGFAIILLTLLVRVAVLPFNVMSYKSMKKMQVIQPIIAQIREKHKEDPMKMNQEVMAVMKENKANPMGGCLPMFLQLPIFFALYQVLGQSIELYQAPFIWWIQDLSLKDPYYILPVLMGITMYLQQKFTPTAMDPTQAKVMMFLPVVFSLFMIALPSGLTLYIFISTLFAVVQQKILMKTV